MNFYDSTTLEFIGFDPSEKLWREAIHTLERIMWEGPSDSTIKLTIVKNKSLFKAYCKIASSVGVFIGKSNNEFGIPALKILEKDTKKKLRSWKEKRKLVDYKWDSNKSQGVG